MRTSLPTIPFVLSEYTREGFQASTCEETVYELFHNA